MAYKKYKLALLFRSAILLLLLAVLTFVVGTLNLETNLASSIFIILVIGVLTVLSFHNLFKFTVRRFHAIDDFFESVMYRDFSRLFNENDGPDDVKELHKKFNMVSNTIKNINKEKETQHLYLQKILEMVHTGIVAYSLETGNVLWINDTFKRVLDIPTIKNVDFIGKRKPKLYSEIFEKDHYEGSTLGMESQSSKIKILVTSSLFHLGEDSIKLIVLQNIEHTLDQNENEAWKKLLSVMTHEIMNSIAPISSLAETLQNKILLSMTNPDEKPLEINDIDIGIDSIRRRSEALMKFAQTYRGLNKITKLNLSKVSIDKLFQNVLNILLPSLESKNVELKYVAENTELELEVDTHLIEQVLINLILNAVEATREKESPKIVLSSEKDVQGHIIIKVTDNGIGIPEDIADKIFIPFFSTKKNGSGVGLSLCKQIMLLHKGKVNISSKQNKGSVISLVF